MHHALARFIPFMAQNQLASRVAWVTIDTVASRGVALIVMLIVARVLGAANFGELTAVLTTVSLFGAFIGESIRVTAIKQVTAANFSDPASAGRALGLTAIVATTASALVSILLWLLADVVATHALNAPHLAGGLMTGVALVFLDSLGAAQRGILMGIGAVRSMAVASVLSGAVAVVLVVVLGEGADVQRYVLLLTAASATGALVRGLNIRTRMRALGIRISHRVPIDEWSILWRFSLPAMLNSLTWFPANWTAMAMLANRPEGFRDIGLFGMANQWFGCLLFLPNIIANTLLPTLARAYATDSQQTVSQVLRLSIRSNLMLSIPAAIAIAAASQWIVQELYGPSFADGALTLCLVAAAAVPASLQGLFGYVLAAKDRMWDSLGAGCIWAMIYLVTAFTGVELGWGANALAFAMVLAYVAKLAAQSWQLQTSRIGRRR